MYIFWCGYLNISVALRTFTSTNTSNMHDTYDDVCVVEMHRVKVFKSFLISNVVLLVLRTDECKGGFCMSYVDYDVSDELMGKVLELLSTSKDGGKIKKGINETTKAVERKTAKLVVLAKDVTPEEIVIHIPMLCKEMGVPYVFVNTKKELGESVGIPVPTSAVAIENPGKATEMLQDLIKRLPEAAKGGAKEKANAKSE